VAPAVDATARAVVAAAATTRRRPAARKQRETMVKTPK